MPDVLEVRYTANFETNLQSIEIFWADNKFPAGYDRLLDELIDTVVTNLERYPHLGRSFMNRRPESVEAQVQLERLQVKMAAYAQPADMREYVMADYVVLYAVMDATVALPSVIHLVSIKHHKQLSFDLERLWKP